MKTFTTPIDHSSDSSGQSALAALSARVLRRAGQSQMRTAPAFIGQSVDAFVDGIAQRFPDVAARFAAASDDAAGYAAIDMPFVSAQGLVDIEDEAQTAEASAELLAQLRSGQSQPNASSRLQTATTPRTTSQPINRTPQPAVQRNAAVEMPNRLDLLRQRTESAFKPATQTPTTSSQRPVQRHAARAANVAQSKPARVVSVVEEVAPKTASAPASLSTMPTAPAPLPETTQAIALQAGSDDVAAPANDSPISSPAMPAGDTTPNVADETATGETITPTAQADMPAVAIQRKVNGESVVTKTDVMRDEDSGSSITQMSAPMQTQIVQPARQEIPRAQHAQRAAADPDAPSVPATSAPDRDTHDAPAEQRDGSAVAQQATQFASEPAPAHIQRSVAAATTPASSPVSRAPALPLLRKAVLPPMGRAGQYAQHTSRRIARKIAAHVQPLAPQMNNAGTDAIQRFVLFPELPAADEITADAFDVASMASGSAPFATPAFDVPDAPFNMRTAPLRAALPDTPAMPRIDMPLAQARNTLNSAGAAAQMQAAQTFADKRGGMQMPNMAMPHLPALPQMQPVGALAGDTNAISSTLQGGVQSAAGVAHSAMNTAQHALGSLLPSAPKPDLDRLARQLLPHLKRMIALERERMRPF